MVGILSICNNTSQYVRRKNIANSWIMHINTSYMYAHSEIYNLTKPIIHSFQYMHHGLRIHTHDRFRHDMLAAASKPISSNKNLHSAAGSLKS